MKSERWKRYERTFEILKTIAGGTILVSSLVAPNLAQLLPAFFSELRTGKRRPFPADVSRTLLRLKRQGMIRLERTQGGYALRLTPDGQSLHDRIFLSTYSIRRPKRWDGKWRVVVFDVKEKRKVTRDMVRERLKHLGFVRLQYSVWIHPFECEEAIELLKTSARVRHDVHYLLVSRMAQDQRLRSHFELPAQT